MPMFKKLPRLGVVILQASESYGENAKIMMRKICSIFCGIEKVIADTFLESSR